MIIYKNPISVITRSDKPNKNWTDDTDVFVVDDNSVLGKKIIDAQPFFDLTLDNDGNLIDVTPTEKPAEPPKPPSETEILGQSVSEREIQEIIQGQQISDLEIRLLTGGL